METIGTMIANARKARNLWMKDLVPHLLKEDGEPISLSYLGLIEQDRSKPSPGLIPQLAEVLGIPADALYAALGLLPPDIRALLTEASTQQALDAFQVVRKILSSLDESWHMRLSGRSVSFEICQQTSPSDLPGFYSPVAHSSSDPERVFTPTRSSVALRKRAALFRVRKKPLSNTTWKGRPGVA